MESKALFDYKKYQNMISIKIIDQKQEWPISWSQSDFGLITADSVIPMCNLCDSNVNSSFSALAAKQVIYNFVKMMAN